MKPQEVNSFVQNRYVEELHLNDPDNNSTSSELLLERSFAEERDPGSTKREPPSSIEETHANQVKIQTNSVYCTEEAIPIEDRKWNGNNSEDILLKPKSQKLVMRLVRHYGHPERETGGAVHWKPMGPKLRKKRFRKLED